MASFEVIKLRFITPLHLGRGIEDDMSKSEIILHSDTLKSAIYAAGLSMYPSWEKEEEYFNGFSVSSCFPFAEKELFFPKPLVKSDFNFEHASSDESKSAKTFKGIRFLSLPVLKQILKGQQVHVGKLQLSMDGDFVFSSATHTDTVFTAEVQQRVTVPRNGEGDAIPYYFDRLFFEKDCGFYFLASFKNNKIRQEVLAAMEVLGEKGIGTDKSSGNGLFYFKEEEIELIDFEDQETSGNYLNLGLYLPAKDELPGIDLEKSSWQLKKRGGYMGGSTDSSLFTLRRKSVYMFTEGSVFKSGKKLNGKYIDLKPEWNAPIHPVWRDGQPIFISF